MRTESPVERYRERAEEARLQAERIHDPTLREHFLDIADSYDSLAESAERLEHQRGRTPRAGIKGYGTDVQ
jgi:hypothetical protein